MADNADAIAAEATEAADNCGVVAKFSIACERNEIANPMNKPMTSVATQ